jgi:hypothetical protein
MEENLRKYIDELISEIQNELDEATTSGNVAGYNVPGAFSNGGTKDKNRKKKIATQLGYTLAGKVDESFMSDLDIIKKGSKDITDFVKRVLSDKQFKEVRTDKDFHKYLKSFYNESVVNSLQEEEGVPHYTKDGKEWKGKVHKMTDGSLMSGNPHDEGGSGTDGKSEKLYHKDELIESVNDDKVYIDFLNKKKGFKQDRVKFNSYDAAVKWAKKNFEKFNHDMIKYESVNESLITEKQLKGLEGISNNTSLEKITKAQKLNIIKGTGNIIDFKVPKGSSQNFWQVIGTGKIKQNSIGQYYLQGKGPNKASPTFKTLDGLIDGVDWKGVEQTRRFNESVNEGPMDRIFGGIPYTKKGKQSMVTMKLPDDVKERIIQRAKKEGKVAKPNMSGGVTVSESVNEAKVQRPVNRWLELKNDETLHPHKKMAMGLKELKYQLAETQKFFNWYNKIKSMNELDSSDYWKRTQSHIYKIKERLVNIARTIQEIEK